MPSAARDPKTIAGGVDESQDRRLGARTRLSALMPLGALPAAACAISTADGALAYSLGFWLRNFAAS